MLLVIDNYDSFTYNLVHQLGKYYKEINVVFNDELDINAIKHLQPNGIVISPGPCGPEQAGISKSVIKTFAPFIPILGVCLGMQCIAEVFGGKIKRASLPLHGKISSINHKGAYIFEGMNTPVNVTRYHSLVMDENIIPDSLIVTAESDKNEIMGIKHKVYDTEGLQFHPESLFTNDGDKMIENFIKQIEKIIRWKEYYGIKIIKSA